jgi:exodeoxyribonuclease VII large subunit
LKPKEAISVTDFTRTLKSDLEGRYKGVHILGEVSNLSRPSSGHVYFTLKDAKAALSCVLWRGTIGRGVEIPKHGDLIEVKGNVTVYEPRGSYQLDVRGLKMAGLGDLERRFQELKKKLLEEGIFDPEKKKALPFLPRRIALITSASGAARHDMEKSIRLRFPPADIVFIGCPVQGMEAVPGIVASIRKAQKIKDVDVVVCGRGGGSLEDLWAFNEEAVVRAFYNCALPIVSAVGHEVDVTLCDFAADHRALTPTAIGEMLVPEWTGLWEMLALEESRLARALKGSLEQARWRLQLISQSPAWLGPQNILQEKQQFLDEWQEGFHSTLSDRVSTFNTDLAVLDGQLKTLSPLATLKRGYSVVTDSSGKLLNMKKVKKEDKIQVRLEGGKLSADVREVNRG